MKALKKLTRSLIDSIVGADDLDSTTPGRYDNWNSRNVYILDANGLIVRLSEDEMPVTGNDTVREGLERFRKFVRRV